MIREAFLIILNLSFFSISLIIIFSFWKIKFSEKLISLVILLLFHSFFYLLVYSNTGNEESYLKTKEFFLGNKILILGVVITSLFAYLFRKDKKWVLVIAVCIFSTYIFFLFFGLEKLSFLHLEFESFKLLKAQNPFILLGGLIIFFIPMVNLSRVSFVLLWIGLISFFYSEKKFLEQSINLEIFHIKYIPHEFFWRGNAFLYEENLGVYDFKRKYPVEEPLYKFSMKPIRRVERKDRQAVQNFVTRMEFPIVIKDEKIITIYEFYRTFLGETFRGVYNIETGIMKIEGPLF
ncbi:MAG: hypothetical protein KDK36_04495 [Leptospiraceae bacterium]|nr:hypothetical protein [Leptospiraceae bacterium]